MDNFLILDLGSSATRELKIYDLDRKKSDFRVNILQQSRRKE